MSFAAGFAAGIAVAKKKFGGGGGGDDKPDADYQKWLDLPEPNDNQAVFLIRITDTSKSLDFDVGTLPTTGNKDNAFSIDWGDGSEIQMFTSTPESVKHSYSNTGEYIITFTNILGYNNFIRPTSNSISLFIMAKYGNDMCVHKIIIQDWSATRNFSSFSNLRYIKLPKSTEFNASFFKGCQALKRIEFDEVINNLYSYMFYQCYNLDFDNININFEGITEIPTFCFAGCLALENMSFSACASIGNNAIAACYNLKSVSFPVCASVGNIAFGNCFKLSSFNAASGCTYGTDCFKNCYKLSPRPDGTEY